MKIGLSVHRVAVATVSLTLFFCAEANSVTPGRAIELVRLCADGAQSSSSIRDHARAERWWRLDRRAFADLQASSHVAADAELGWLADETGVMLTLGTEGPRLAALGDPQEAGERTVPVQACTVYATRTDPDAIKSSLREVVLFGAPIGSPTDQVEVGTRTLQSWVLRSGSGEVAYVYAEFGGAVAIIEVGRVIGAP
ncbi:hypothetical protein [Terricaulis sp.]|uniref:hypothetical protein n=1 Tax=Terricaulis sp. TaxID=2768686 RepID=UPI002AC568E6|nr:hypothetical protein [Terricaulis sp.]MDZ4691192.1 hypothetical protein [Terricaulis sp.]